LRDQHAVEWVFVRAGKESGTGGVRGCDGKRLKRFLEKDCVKTESKVGGLRKFAEAGFGGDLRCRGSTDEDGVGTRADESAGAGRKCGIVSEPPEKCVGVQKETQESLPGFEFGVGQRLEEFRADLEFSFHASRFALPLFLTERLKANERLIAASDDDLFAITGFFDETREVGLGVMDLDRGHIS
jgi:hypothetical protein